LVGLEGGDKFETQYVAQLRHLLASELKEELLEIIIFLSLQLPQGFDVVIEDEPSVVNDANPGADFFRDMETMGGHENHFPLGGLLTQKLLDDMSCLWVETDHWFVDDDDRRIVQEGCGNDYSLSHTLGIGYTALVDPGTDFKQIY